MERLAEYPKSLDECEERAWHRLAADADTPSRQCLDCGWYIQPVNFRFAVDVAADDAISEEAEVLNRGLADLNAGRVAPFDPRSR